MSKKVVVNVPYFMSIVNNVIPCVTSYYVKRGRSKWFQFYVNTAQNKNSAADGALILSLVTPTINLFNWMFQAFICVRK